MCYHRPQLPTERLPSVIVHRAITLSATIVLSYQQNDCPQSSSTEPSLSVIVHRTIVHGHRLQPSPSVIDYNHRPQSSSTTIALSHRLQPSPSVIDYNHRPQSSSTTIALSHRLQPSPSVIVYNHRPQASSTEPSPSVIAHNPSLIAHNHRPQSSSTEPALSVTVHRTIAMSLYTEPSSTT